MQPTTVVWTWNFQCTFNDRKHTQQPPTKRFVGAYSQPKIHLFHYKNAVWRQMNHNNNISPWEWMMFMLICSRLVQHKVNEFRCYLCWTFKKYDNFIIAQQPMLFTFYYTIISIKCFHFYKCEFQPKKTQLFSSWKIEEKKEYEILAQFFFKSIWTAETSHLEWSPSFILLSSQKK